MILYSTQWPVFRGLVYSKNHLRSELYHQKTLRRKPPNNTKTTIQSDKSTLDKNLSGSTVFRALASSCHYRARCVLCVSVGEWRAYGAPKSHLKASLPASPPSNSSCGLTLTHCETEAHQIPTYLSGRDKNKVSFHSKMMSSAFFR